MSRLRDCLLRLAGSPPSSSGTSSTGSQPLAAHHSDTIPLTDPLWSSLLTIATAADIQALSIVDIRFIRDAHKVNFLTLIRVLSQRVVRHVKRTSTDYDELLNVIRLLTRVIPILFEDDTLNSDKSLFWTVNSGVQFSQSPSSSMATVGSFSSGVINSDDISSVSASSTKVNIDAQVGHSADSLEVNIGRGKGGECLGLQLIFAIVDLLFWRGFTIEDGNIKGVDLRIWEMGIGMNGKYGPADPYLDANRLEILRLLLTLCSGELYLSSKEVVSKGSRFLTVLVSTLPRLKFLTFICSLLNLTCRSIKANADINGLTYINDTQYRHLRKSLVTQALQLLTSMLVYPLPSTDTHFLTDLNIFPMTTEYTRPTNLVRSYLGKLHKENELNFVYSSLYQFLNQPLESAIETEASPFHIMKNNPSGNSLPKLSPWSIEIVMLLWELIQCNKNFKRFIQEKRSNELLVTLLYYLKYYKTQPSLRMNLIRVISFLFLYLISDSVILQRTLLPFNNSHYSSKIPQFYRLNQTSTNVTYRDFLIITISNMINNLNDFDTLITPTLFEYIYNLIPIPPPTDDLKIKATLSYHSCVTVMNVLSTYSSSDDLLKDNLKLDLFTLLLRSVANAITRYFKESRTLMYLVVKHEKMLQGLYSSLKDYKFSSDDIAVPTSLQPPQSPMTPRISLTPTLGTPLPGTPHNERSEDEDNEEGEEEEDEFEECLKTKPPVGMSKKAKLKLPMDVSLITQWPGYKSLMILLKLVKFCNTELAMDSTQLAASKFEIMEILIKIENLKPILDSKFFSKLPSEFNAERSEFEPLKFHWSELSLGWYSSILWGQIYLSNNITAHRAHQQQHIDSNSTNGWFARKSSSYSIKDVASSWGFNWRSSSTSSTGKQNSAIIGSPTTRPSGLDGAAGDENTFTLENGILSMNMWRDTHVKLFKIKKDTTENGGTLNSMTDLMKRFRLGGTEAAPNTPVTSNGHPSAHGHRVSISGGSPYQLTPINSRHSTLGTPRNSIVGGNDLSRISSRQSFV